jgi:HlyD family secretion protein
MFRDTSATDTKLVSSARVSRRTWIIGGVVAAVLIAAVYAVLPTLTADQTLSRERVRVVQVKRGTLVRDVSAQGRMVAARSPSLYTSAAGIVKFHVEPGAPVTSGTLLAEVESPELMSQLKREESALARVTAQLARQEIANRRTVLEKQRSIDAANVSERAATRELERAERAWKMGAIAEVDLKKAQDEMQNAASTLKTAQADLALERDSLVLELKTYSEELSSQKLLVDELNRQVTALSVRAPFDGVVGNWLVTDRASVAVNQALLTVVDLTELEVEAAVSEVYADTLIPGQAAEITIGNEKRRGSVHLVSPEVQNAQVFARIRLTDGGSVGLRQNQRVQVRVLLEEKPDVLLVDRGPIFERDASFAWVVDGDVARRTPIRLGASSVTAFEVLGGLESGQQVIVAGIDDLRGVDEVLLTR